jgi:hypothetical protein
MEEDRGMMSILGNRIMMCVIMAHRSLNRDLHMTGMDVNGFA